jgi:protein-S-isoprenylcysteine O-methyltransferase Ste14
VASEWPSSGSEKSGLCSYGNHGFGGVYRIYPQLDGTVPPDPVHVSEPFMKDLVTRIVTGIIGLGLFAGLWFVIAGRLTWWQGWVFLFSFIAYTSVLVWRLSKLNPELVRERNQPAEKAEPWDRVVMGIYTVILLILLIVTALDGGRYLWSSVPLGIQLIGWLLLAVAGLMVWHVMMTNAYLSSWARLQEDREQVVVQEGAYRHIRHPMYLGIIVAFLGIPLALGSWWAMIPSIVIDGLFVYRTYREDLMLIHGLSGYAEYTERVRYRLLPGIW